ncbi:MAG: hypothetical protein K0U93_28310 [Gammaproteobacteria bacterium]|nr:hypothetical protein [Gammaproteobacteria bacterium]
MNTLNQLNPLRGLTNPGPAQQGLLGYLALQALVLLVWWPKSNLMHRINTVGEPTTLSAVVMFTGAALAYFALRLGTEELAISQPSLSASHSSEETSPWTTLRTYFSTHFVQLGYLMALCTPLILVAHSIASVSAVGMLWIGAITAVHTTFYRLLGAWLQLRWADREALVTITSRVVLIGAYLCATAFAPTLSHASLSFQLGQPRDGSADRLATSALQFIVTYGALSALLSVGLLRELLPRGGDRTRKSQADP